MTYPLDPAQTRWLTSFSYAEAGAPTADIAGAWFFGSGAIVSYRCIVLHDNRFKEYSSAGLAVYRNTDGTYNTGGVGSLLVYDRSAKKIRPAAAGETVLSP